MAYKLKKKFVGKSLANINKPLNDLTEEDIKSLSDKTKELIFIKETPKNKKKDVAIKD